MSTLSIAPKFLLTVQIRVILLLSCIVQAESAKPLRFRGGFFCAEVAHGPIHQLLTEVVEVSVSVLPEYDWDLHHHLMQMLARDGNQRRFYMSARWRRLRAKVLEESHFESQDELHATPARIVLATCVHHVMHVDELPGWALSEWYVDDSGQCHRNLIALSHEAHDARHGRMRFAKRKPQFELTKEMW